MLRLPRAPRQHRMIPWASMDKLFAKHADIGHLHLETQHVDGKWEWFVLDTRTKHRIASGRAHSAEQAKEAAEKAAGGSPTQWRNIGKEIKVKFHANG